LTRGETMQPARAAAADAARLAGHGGLVLLPRGNDGVGVVGPFLIEAPPWLMVRLVAADAPAAGLRAAATGYKRVVLALVGVDRQSRATVPRLRAAFIGPGWRVVGKGFDGLALARCGAHPPVPARARRGGGWRSPPRPGTGHPTPAHADRG
ncbi:MAG: hypothetical protein ACREFY_05330, partial [Acetobacteraceae bacterium]